MKLLSGLVAIGSALGGTLASREQPTGTRPAPSYAEAATSLTFFTDRAAFLARFPNLLLEDFERGKAPFGGTASCPGPVDALSDNTCFSPGTIQPGVEFNSERPNFGEEIALVGQGFFQAPSQSIAANDWSDAFIIDFTSGNVTATGMDLFAWVGEGDCQIDIYGTDGPLGSTTAPCTNLGVFWGVSSDKVITRIRIFSPDRSEGVDNISFGVGAAQPGVAVDPPVVLPVVLDIKPGNATNPINLYSRGVIPVAVLSSRIAAGGASDFDATQIDVRTVAFGPGRAPVDHGSRFEDVNGDGLLDMVFLVSTEASNLSCGDTRATLTGRTVSGQQFSGTDVVRMVECANPSASRARNGRP